MKTQINKKIPKSDPETISPLKTEDTEMHTPQLTNTLVGKTLEKERTKEQKNGLRNSDNSK